MLGWLGSCLRLPAALGALSSNGFWWGFSSTELQRPLSQKKNKPLALSVQCWGQMLKFLQAEGQELVAPDGFSLGALLPVGA